MLSRAQLSDRRALLVSREVEVVCTDSSRSVVGVVKAQRRVAWGVYSARSYGHGVQDSSSCRRVCNTLGTELIGGERVSRASDGKEYPGRGA